MANSELTSRGLSLKDLLEKQDFPLLTSSSKKQDTFLLSPSGSKNYSDKASSDDEQSNISAFLGPNLWEKSYGTDFKLEYMDLDEFLVENGIPTDPIAETFDNQSEGSPGSTLEVKSSLSVSPPASPSVDENYINSDNESMSSIPHSGSNSSSELKEEQDEILCPENDYDDEDDDSDYVYGTASKKPGSSKAPGEKGFDPTKRKFSTDELKPQPLIKKSRKVFVPDDHKDDRYWARRKKNNVAAKRSRDARRVKENQIALRANFLESENQMMKAKLEKALKDMAVIKKEKETLLSENLYLQKQLKKYTL